MQSDKPIAAIFLAALIVFSVSAITPLASCSAPDKSRETLEAAGYKDIEITGYRPLMCSEDDSLRTGFTAKGANGARVSGAVCCRYLFKGCTIRTD